jgi:hypothetical protein
VSFRLTEHARSATNRVRGDAWPAAHDQVAALIDSTTARDGDRKELSLNTCHLRRVACNNCHSSVES